MRRLSQVTRHRIIRMQYFDKSVEFEIAQRIGTLFDLDQFQARQVSLWQRRQIAVALRSKSYDAAICDCSLNSCCLHYDAAVWQQYSSVAMVSFCHVHARLSQEEQTSFFRSQCSNMSHTIPIGTCFFYLYIYFAF